MKISELRAYAQEWETDAPGCKVSRYLERLINVAEAAEWYCAHEHLPHRSTHGACSFCEALNELDEEPV